LTSTDGFYWLLSNIPLLLIQSIRVEILFFSGCILILLWLVFLIAGGEHALFSLTPSELEELEKKNPRAFKNIQHLIVRPRQLLVLVKLLQMAITVTILFLAAKIGLRIFHGSPFAPVFYVCEILLFILILLITQEIISKYFAGRNNLLWAKWMGTAIYFLSRIFYPFTELIIELSNLVEKRFARQNDGQEEVMQKQEEQLAESTNDEKEVPLLTGILKFRTILVRQIMKSRLDMTAVEEQTSFDQLLKTVRETRYSRLPVYSGTVDRIIGILYTKDLLNLQDGKDRRWQSLIRPAYFVPEGKKISEVLEALQHQQMHLAIVVDEYGRVAGLVTLEDIVEEIIGEIRDETDERFEVEYQKINDDTYIFEGKTRINDFYRIMNIEETFFDDVKTEADSLGGLLLEIGGTIPGENETIKYKNFHFTVLSLENYRIKKVKVTRKTTEERRE